MYWLRRRLGCVGRERLRILEALRGEVGEVWTAPSVALGLPPARIARFAQDLRVAEIADVLSGRGDAAGLAQIAWWGSALADLAPSPSPSDQGSDDVLTACAAFNLAVALFDSAIEAAPARRLALVEALAPQRLRARLHDPLSHDARLRSEDAVAALVAALFDRAVSTAGRQFGNQKPTLNVLGDLLEAMYRSVLGQIDDPFIAKTGPVIFIGYLAGGGRDEAARALYAALARFCQIWDDALDVFEDLAVLAPNHFLGKGWGLGPLPTMAQVLRGTYRVVAGASVHGDISRALVKTLRATVDGAQAWHQDTHTKTLALCRQLVS